MISCSTEKKETAGDQPRTRIYATFVSHNERSPHAECDPVVTDQAGYLANRALTRKFAEMIVTHQAAWDMQSDYQYLEAVQAWDTDTEKASTDGKNLIQYLAELSPDRIVLDAHGHTETGGPNYADISYLHELLGAPRNGVVGGFIYDPTESETWTQFETITTGRVNPAVAWASDILWGGGTLNHQGVDDTSSGVWRPKDASNFYVDDPGAHLVNIGAYWGNPEGLTDLLDKLHSGRLEQGRMYTAAIFFNQCTLSDDIVQQLAVDIDAHAADAASGDLVWATLPEIERIWREDYSSTPIIFVQ
jgi:hypothetical protein